MVYLGVVAAVRDHLRWLPEWLAFHRAQGVNHFWLLDPEAPGLREVVHPWASSVTVVPWAGPGLTALQARAHYRGEVRWLMPLSTDDFVYGDRKTVHETLLGLERWPIVTARRGLFGPSGYGRHPEGALVTQTYVRRARARMRVQVAVQPDLMSPQNGRVTEAPLYVNRYVARGRAEAYARLARGQTNIVSPEDEARLSAVEDRLACQWNDNLRRELAP